MAHKIPGEKVKLKRELGLFEVCIYGVGLILGAGIYTVIGEAAGLTGNSLPIAFIIAAAIAALTGLSYAELSSMYPKEEGGYLYVKKAFETRALSDLTALSRLFVGAVATAAVALAFSGYVSSFVSAPAVPVAIMLIVVTSFVNFYGIEFSVKINILFTSIEVLGLLIIIAIGAGSWGSVQLTHLPFGFKGLIGSTFLLFFAYLGFSSIVNVSEETKDAEKEIPKAIIISIAVTTVLYFFVALSSIGVVDWRVLGESSSPLAQVALQGWGRTALKAIGVIAIFSTTNTVLIELISTSRILYGVSKKESYSFPVFLSKIHPKRRTPYIAVAVIGVLSILFTFISDIGIVAGLSNVFLFIVFILVNASLLKLRYKYPDEERGFKAPFNIGKFSLTAAIGVFICTCFVVFYVLQNLL